MGQEFSSRSMHVRAVDSVAEIAKKLWAMAGQLVTRLGFLGRGADATPPALRKTDETDQRSWDQSQPTSHTVRCVRTLNSILHGVFHPLHLVGGYIYIDFASHPSYDGCDSITRASIVKVVLVEVPDSHPAPCNVEDPLAPCHVPSLFDLHHGITILRTPPSTWWIEGHRLWGRCGAYVRDKPLKKWLL